MFSFGNFSLKFRVGLNHLMHLRRLLCGVLNTSKASWFNLWSNFHGNVVLARNWLLNAAMNMCNFVGCNGIVAADFWGVLVNAGNTLALSESLLLLVHILLLDMLNIYKFFSCIFHCWLSLKWIRASKRLLLYASIGRLTNKGIIETLSLRNCCLGPS